MCLAMMEMLGEDDLLVVMIENAEVVGQDNDVGEIRVVMPRGLSHLRVDHVRQRRSLMPRWRITGEKKVLLLMHLQQRVLPLLLKMRISTWIFKAGNLGGGDYASFKKITSRIVPLCLIFSLQSVMLDI
jgi:hypothetical protein